MSEGVEGRGIEFFANAERLGLEGVIAKRLAGRYLPGRRSDSWIKIKRQLIVACAVIGFLPEGNDDFESLLIAAQDPPGDPPRYVGRVGSGFDEKARAKINRFLWAHRQPKSVVPAREKRALWVEAGLYCTVRCMERTASGQLRAPTVTEILMP
jgi:bifunctional non-homologous end joining protein LigD